MNSNQSLPTPRPGLIGSWDRLIGPGASRTEVHLILGGGLLLTTLIALSIYNRRSLLDWSLLQGAIALLAALDLSGGLISNATSTTKRWYYRPGQGKANHLGFVAVHGLYPLLVAWLFRDSDWPYFLVVYGYLLFSSLLTEELPDKEQRPLAFLFMGGAILLNQYAFAPTPGLEWFIPFLFLKLLLGHMLPEDAQKSAPAPERNDG